MGLSLSSITRPVRQLTNFVEEQAEDIIIVKQLNDLFDWRGLVIGQTVPGIITAPVQRLQERVATFTWRDSFAPFRQLGKWATDSGAQFDDWLQSSGNKLGDWVDEQVDKIGDGIENLFQRIVDNVIDVVDKAVDKLFPWAKWLIPAAIIAFLWKSMSGAPPDRETVLANRAKALETPMAEADDDDVIEFTA